ncbi:MAG: alpha/beta fold hydrolase [Cytophagaceae bacterium]
MKKNKGKKQSAKALYLVLSVYRLWFKVYFQLSSPKAIAAAFRLFATPRAKLREKERMVLSGAEKHVIEFEGKKIATYRWGKSDMRILCIHGWEGNGGNFGAFIDRFLPLGYEIISYDAPAHNQSTGRTTNLFQFARLAASMMEKEKPIAVIGHSFGSASAILAQTRFTEYRVPRIAMLSAPDKLLNVVNDFSNLMRFSDTMHQVFIAYMEKRFKVNLEDVRVSAVIHECNSEMLLIHDRYDKVIPFSYAENVVAHNSKINLIAIKQVGHYRMLWNKEVVDRVEVFLKE